MTHESPYIHTIERYLYLGADGESEHGVAAAALAVHGRLGNAAILVAGKKGLDVSTKKWEDGVMKKMEE